MTQRNIEIMDVIVDKMVAGKTLSDALKDVYTKRNVAIPFDDEDLNVPIDELGMSKRTTYTLIRGKMMTLADAVAYCQNQKTFETMLNYLWDKMDKQIRVEFLIDTIERNEENLRDVIL